MSHKPCTTLQQCSSRLKRTHISSDPISSIRTLGVGGSECKQLTVAARSLTMSAGVLLVIVKALPVLGGWGVHSHTQTNTHTLTHTHARAHKHQEGTSIFLFTSPPSYLFPASGSLRQATPRQSRRVPTLPPLYCTIMSLSASPHKISRVSSELMLVRTSCRPAGLPRPSRTSIISCTVGGKRCLRHAKNQIPLAHPDTVLPFLLLVKKKCQQYPQTFTVAVLK